ncbi:oxysterol-binding protein-related protein 11 [Oncorhynchus tshawytscha]|uniref:Oxysterol-binding protein n=1 Tax=Oncorhynchus tshawytscha TaxID=74940 RepID=A0AAZ3PTZ3_ONCTS|nr:oxysterol-binding protein-related protein 11 [Oncorhynchus tshawytscha]
MTMQGETVTAIRISDSEGKLDVFPQKGTPGSSGRGSSKGWQYSDHMENIDGYLMKYTNLVTGWQYRFFVLNNEAGLLEYFVNEQSRPQKPRGTLPLAGAVISPSDEDSHTFTVNAISGEQYKLRATDAKERQHWVSRLQICTQHHTEAMGKSNPPPKSRSYSMASQGSASSPLSQRRPSQNAASFFSMTQLHKGSSLYSSKRSLLPDHLLDAREMMTQAQGQHRDLIQTIEGLPPVAGPLSPLDQDLLMLKATSMATMNCLNDCLHILQLQQVARQRSSLGGPTIEWLEPKLPDILKNGGPLDSFSTEGGPLEGSLLELSATEPCSFSGEEIDGEDEVEDAFTEKEEELGAVEEERSVILHLLSQLKLGMDLTRVVLPTFILEKRSLLEMYADFMSHPDLFVAITDGQGPEERMVRFVEYYLTSFHEGRKGAIAKKPYNPIIGESFHCSWRVPRSGEPAKDAPSPSSPPQGSPTTEGEDGSYQLRFVAEQVSHHPPVSGFYAECPERRMCVNTHVWTKSKFMGMSIGVSMIGEGCLYLLEHDEEYTFTLPCAYARSILTVPWVELGGKVNVNCTKSGYSAVITFQTKPFYGGKLHKVTAEVKHNATSAVVCRVQGEWNGVLEFSYQNGDTCMVDVTKLPVTKKRVRPNDKQGPTESRRLWQHVTESLRQKDIEKATEYKRILEERQRTEERHRTETETPWRTRYFESEGEGWMYHKPLWKTPTLKT